MCLHIRRIVFRQLPIRSGCSVRPRYTGVVAGYHEKACVFRFRQPQVQIPPSPLFPECVGKALNLSDLVSQRPVKIK